MNSNKVLQIAAVIIIVLQTNIFSQEVSTLIAGFSNTSIEGLTIDKFGNLYTPSGPAGLVYKITPSETGATTEVIATGLNFPQGGTTDNEGNYYSSVWSSNLIRKITREGVSSIFATSLSGPTGLIIDNSGTTMYACNFSTNSVAKIDMSTKQVTIFAAGNQINGPDGIAFDDNENLYVANARDNKILKVTPSGDINLFAMVPGSNSGYLAFTKGNLYSAGLFSNKIYKITLIGEVTELAGTGNAGFVDGNHAAAQFNTPNGITASLTGDSLFIADAANRAIRIIDLTSSTTSVYQEDDLLTIGFKLNQNYPNPFNPSTTINYELNKTANVSLKIYDALGNLITEILNEEKIPGNYTMNFDGNNLSSGIYYYTLSTNHSSITKKMILLK